MTTVGIILAGGLSRRFGSPKAFAKLNGHYFYDYAVRALEQHCASIVIVTRPELVDQFPSQLQVIVDEEKYIGLGPLAGIYSAMKAKKASRYVVLPCDMPYMDGEFMGQLLVQQDANVVAVKTQDYHHPLVSVWKRTVLPQLEKTLAQENLRVVPFLNTVGTKWIRAEHLAKNYNQLLKNINHQEDLGRGEKT